MSYSGACRHIIEQMLEFLPDKIKNAILRLNANKLFELRIRAGMPIAVNYGGEYLYLCSDGAKNYSDGAIVASADDICDAVYNACGKSVYSVSEEIKQGFISVGNVRIGLCGTCVSEGDKVVSVRDFTSLCVRVPHIVKGCAERILNAVDVKENSLLILSPPGCGKTTLLKDIARAIADDGERNLLICDERGEIAPSAGLNADVIKYSAKRIAFTNAVRAMRPDIIITDELTEEDYPLVKKTMATGVKVTASAHLERAEDVPMKIFDCYVVLKKGEVGEINKIYDKNMDVIYA